MKQAYDFITEIKKDLVNFLTFHFQEQFLAALGETICFFDWNYQIIRMQSDSLAGFPTGKLEKQHCPLLQDWNSDQNTV